MTRTLSILIILGLTSPAFAHDTTPVEKVVGDVGYQLSKGLGDGSWTPGSNSLEELAQPAACTAATKDLAADAHLYMVVAIPGVTASKDDEGYYITGADAKSVCARYAAAFQYVTVAAAVIDAANDASTIKRPVEGMYEAEANMVGVHGKACADAVDAALAGGMKPTDTIRSKKDDLAAIALGEVKATYCQPSIDWSAKRVAEIKGAATAKQDAIAAVYKKAGIKGKRLDLFVSFGMPDDAGFYLAGCEQYATTAAAMKKAKKLFVWLEGSDGYTIRTFTFHGDDYVETDHSYEKQAQAYRGCR